MKSLYKIMAEINKKAEKYFYNPLFYAKEIKNMLQKDFPDVRVLVFGSSIRGDHMPDSDIDILAISDIIPKGLFDQAEVKLRIKNQFPDAPFELHLVTSEEYGNWYKNFIKDEFKEI